MAFQRKRQVLSPKEALPKLMRYCSFQERSHREVRVKLNDFFLTESEIDEVISELITQNFLNEERYAIAYAGGKFRTRKWGRIKIEQMLKFNEVSERNIKKALDEIPSTDYNNAITEVAIKRLESEKEKDPLKRKFKTANYLMSRGFENDLIFKVLEELL